MDVIFILLFPEWSPAFEILIDWYFIALVFVDVPTVFLSDHSGNRRMKITSIFKIKIENS